MKELQIANPWPGAPVYFKEKTESTMEDASRLFLSGCPDGTVVLTDFQQRGRGRVADRRWAADPGKNLLFTVVLRISTGSGGIGGSPQRLPLLAGLALALSIEEMYDLSVQLKWPNDLLVGGRKLAGILCEALVEGSRLGVLVGIGLNCNQVEFPEDLEPEATSLARILGREVSLPALLEEVLSRLKTSLADQQWHTKVSTRLFGLNRAAYLSVPSQDGRPSKEQGGTPIRGRIHGLARDGALLFQPDGRLSDGRTASRHEPEGRTPRSAPPGGRLSRSAPQPIAVYGGEIRLVADEDC